MVSVALDSLLSLYCDSPTLIKVQGFDSFEVLGYLGIAEG